MVKEAFRAVVVALFARILVVGRAVTAFPALRILLGGFNHFAVLIEKTDSVVGKQDKLTEGLCTRRCDNGGFLIIFGYGTQSAVIFSVGRLNNNRSEPVLCSDNRLIPKY